MNALLIVDNPKRWPLKIPGAELVAARDYLSLAEHASRIRVKVFNLCRSYGYQTSGYYVSLLAQARGHRPIPSVTTLQDLRLAAELKVASRDLDELIQRSLKGHKAESFDLRMYFGRSFAKKYDQLGTALFNAFPAPFLEVSFSSETDGGKTHWEIESIRIIGAGDIPDDHKEFIAQAAQEYLAKPPRPRKAKNPARFDLAILHDPEDPLPCSNAKALKNFREAAEDMGLRTEMLVKEEIGRLNQFDALFIRDTTGVNNHTYRFARRAQAEGLAVLDHPESILRCNNKVYVAELLDRYRVATPKTVIFSEDTAWMVAERIGFPCVIKQPDSSFSAGVVKINSADEFLARREQLFETSELLLAQEFVPTEFDWRVGVLEGKPLYVCKYMMAERHWQIIRRDERGEVHEGGFETLSIEDAPKDVVQTGVKAAKLIGDGLYGIDIKVLGGRPKVIEINDNPNIYAGVEDKVLGEELYKRVMQYLLTRVEERVRRQTPGGR